MKRRANTLFPLAMAFGLALLSFWLERAVQAPGAVPTATAGEPDYLVEHFNAVALDKTGRPQSSLAAVRMVHFPDTEITEVEAPRVTHRREGEPPIRITASRGEVTKDGEEVRLFDDVVITREATKGRPELRLETTYLQLFREAEIARTSARVVIFEGSSRITGVGMEADNKARTIELKSQVSGVIDPNARRAQ